MKALKLMLKILYRIYRIEWRLSHRYAKGNEEPVCFEEWLSNEFLEMVEELVEGGEEP